MTKTIRKTWNEFWGALLMVRCHQDNPQRWSKREERADWIFRALPLCSTPRILDLGCGDGILDICLARLGAKVTAVDRIRSVLATAEKESKSKDDEESESGKIDFVLGDLREVTFPSASFDAVLMLELVGLMSKGDDAKLIHSASRWITQGGLLVVDCPLAPEATEGQSRREFDDGLLEYRWTYDSTSRLQHIVPTYHAKTGELIELYDPYDRAKAAHLGVLRYLYPRAELRNLLNQSGFRVREVESHGREGCFLLVGELGE
jgi:SAM-dependent methyltransferase